ncbi:MAG: rne [Rickettsiales bacterium]|jgi:ribonuclease E|nr:rne [Rickettsiales bacterium]
MTRRILIDAVHPEETRVVIQDEERIEDFDYESSSKRQIKGNVYLAKITRVEPSLQAAFVDYGGEKHGFLPFAEIHPDYYQIPVADRQRLIEEAMAEAARERDEEERTPSSSNNRKRRYRKNSRNSRQTRSEETFEEGDGNRFDEHAGEDPNGNMVPFDDTEEPNGNLVPGHEHHEPEESFADDEPQSQFIKHDDAAEASEGDDAMGSAGNFSDDDEEDGEERHRLIQRSIFKRYKIQEVIKRGQLVQVQVVKEERGNKGASLTTYISLAGRYCVFMPKSTGQGGVSRRISGQEERKRLKEALSELDLEAGTSMIIRTAGTNAPKADIKRDYDYLKRLWAEIRDNTIASTAPAFIHTEGDLLRRFIRDNYDDNIEEILVEGDEAYPVARDFMKKIMPNRVHCVKQYRQKIPLFSRYKTEDQLTLLYKQNVPLQSGGYLVINPTEALVSVDVNSGRATSERNVEETALKTNLEATRELARQLRLRDLSGLIVIDFIDMMEYRNRRTIERALRDALQSDRARVQIGRISSFGLMEMSRQRLRSSFMETNTVPCSHCEGTGTVRGANTTAVMLLRAVEHALAGGKCKEVHAFATPEVVVHTLNAKRDEINTIELRHGIRLFLYPDANVGGEGFKIEKRRQLSKGVSEPKPAVQSVDYIDEDAEHPSFESESESAWHGGEEEREESPESDNSSSYTHERGRNRRGGRGGRNSRRGRDRSSSDRGAERSSERSSSDRGPDRGRGRDRHDRDRPHNDNRGERGGDRNERDSRRHSGGSRSREVAQDSLLKGLWKRIIQ